MQWLMRTNLRPLLLFTAACLMIGEQYPFSNFPMYSSFGRDTYYVYLADPAGEPLPTVKTVGVTTAILKKIYDTELRRELKQLKTQRRRLSAEQKRPVGERVLRSLAADIATPPMRLYEVNLSLEGGRFAKKTELIAEAL